MGPSSFLLIAPAIDSEHVKCAGLLSCANVKGAMSTAVLLCARLVAAPEHCVLLRARWSLCMLTVGSRGALPGG